MRSNLEHRGASLVVIGDPRSRRMTYLRDAATRCGIPCRFLSYHELCTESASREHVRSGDLVRIETPGESPETMRLILRSGIEPMEEHRRVPLTAEQIDAQPVARGEIIAPLQWFLGFKRILCRLDASWESQDVEWMNSPEAVATAFDKQACRDLWSAAGLPIAPGIAGIGTYAQLRAARPQRHARLFLKLRYGFSAMGAVAVEWRGDLVRAITTVEVSWHAGRARLFVTKRPRVLQREFEIAWLVDTLAMEDIIVEDWLSKARWHGKPFDLRIVTIDGKARHVVGRSSSSPFTNLNLDAGRIAANDIKAHLREFWPDVLTLAERAAGRIRGARYLGMDVLVRPGRRRSVLLEANAFGDYLPGLLSDGESTYSAELQSCLQQKVLR